MVGQTNNTASSSPCQPVSSSTMSSKSNINNAANNSAPPSVPAAASSSSNRCVWCRENKRQLNYVLPTQHGKKECCSEICLLEFRRAYNKGSITPCGQCECVVRVQPAPHLTHNSKDHQFCSDSCANEFRQKHNIVVTSSKQFTQHNTPTLTPAAKKKQYDPNKDFRWDEYLALTNSRRAPPRCFRQHLTPPTNEFATDMKLEAIDPRNTTSTCIATVIGSVGPRIRLRLDGSDNANDFWRMVDSNEIQPIGTCEKNGGLLQPPLGFRMNASFWPMFLCKTLNGAQMAPEKCFKEQPPTPRFNLFRVGEKLEAVDRKNPQLICVATVGAVDRDNIHITFDGWSGTFDYWTKYDSTEIFPVGWCEMANHPLQPPGNKAPLIHSPHNLAAANASTTQSLTPQSNHHQISENSTTATSSLITPSPATSPSSQQQQHQIPPYTVTLHVHPSCDCGPYLDQSKLRSSPTIIGPSNIQEVYNQFIQILKQCCVKTAPVDKLVQLQGTEIHEQGDFWTEILGLTERFKFCDNMVNDKPFDDEDDTGRSSSRDRRGVTHECHKCGGTKTKDDTRKSSTGGGLKRKNNVATPPKKIVKQQQQLDQQPATKQINNSTNLSSAPCDPSDWDVESVIGAIVNVDKSMDMYAELFRKHEIDGKAMLLLNSDMMMRYMGLKLGPALKICNIISKFKSKCMKNGSNNGV